MPGSLYSCRSLKIVLASLSSLCVDSLSRLCVDDQDDWTSVQSPDCLDFEQKSNHPDHPHRVCLGYPHRGLLRVDSLDCLAQSRSRNEFPPNVFCARLGNLKKNQHDFIYYFFFVPFRFVRTDNFHACIISYFDKSKFKLN